MQCRRHPTSPSCSARAGARALLRAGAGARRCFLTVWAGCAHRDAGSSSACWCATQPGTGRAEPAAAALECARAADATRWSGRLAAAPRLEKRQRGLSGQGRMSGWGRRTLRAEASRHWWEEKAHFTRGTFPRVSRTGCLGGCRTLHADRVARHSDGRLRRDAGTWNVLVCRYAPRGDVVGQTPF
jgi:hypothetical protein